MCCHERGHCSLLLRLISGGRTHYVRSTSSLARMSILFCRRREHRHQRLRRVAEAGSEGCDDGGACGYCPRGCSPRAAAVCGGGGGLGVAQGQRRDPALDSPSCRCCVSPACRATSALFFQCRPLCSSQARPISFVFYWEYYYLTSTRCHYPVLLRNIHRRASTHTDI